MFMLWTVRLSVALYLTALALSAIAEAGGRVDQFARACWSAGCALLWVHVFLAFDAVHGWAHADAVRHTADRTAELTGVRSGAGVYLNYLTMAVWAGDVAWWWGVGTIRYRARPRAAAWAVHGFLLFIVVNAAVVFAPSPVREVAATGLAAAGLVALRRWLARDAAVHPGPKPRVRPGSWRGRA